MGFAHVIVKKYVMAIQQYAAFTAGTLRLKEKGTRHANQ